MKNTTRLLIVLIAIVIGIAIAGCVSNIPKNETIPTPTEREKTPSPENITKAASNGTIKCELCHTGPQNLSPHVNGGKLCINCHGSQVHNIHVGVGTVNLDCNTCHGFPPTIPNISKGEGPGYYSVCENCHAPPPDNLNASNGNLIVIHLSRGKHCVNCHGTDIGVIHDAALVNMINRTKK